MNEPITMNEIFEMANDRPGQHANRAAAVAVLRRVVNEFVRSSADVLDGDLRRLDDARRSEKTLTKLARGVRDCDVSRTWAITGLVQ